MKTTETRSYLSRLIWATNGWKRPQYGNPETKPVWWPNELLNWAEMKKMGGKKADGLSNVNYNEIQKTILQEVTYCSLYIFYITFCITSDAIKIEPNTAVFYY
jgi:hypothetical protein